VAGTHAALARGRGGEIGGLGAEIAPERQKALWGPLGNLASLPDVYAHKTAESW